MGPTHCWKLQKSHQARENHCLRLARAHVPGFLLPNWQTRECGWGPAPTWQSGERGLFRPPFSSATTLMNSWVSQKPLKNGHPWRMGALVLWTQRNFKSNRETLYQQLEIRRAGFTALLRLCCHYLTLASLWRCRTWLGSPRGVEGLASGAR